MGMGGGESEVYVEGERNGEGGDVGHPSGAGFSGEEGKRVSGEDEGETLTVGEEGEPGVKAGRGEKRVEGVEVFSKVWLEDRAGEEGVTLVTRGEGAVRTPPVRVGEVRDGGRVKMVGGEGAALATETEEGGGARESGVGPEPEGGGEETVAREVGGDEGGVGLTAAEEGEGGVREGGSTPRVVREGGEGKL